MVLSGWGRYPRLEAQSCPAQSRQEVADCLAEPGALIPRGLGRSYGDSALAPKVLTSARRRLFLAWDEQSGRLTCQAGCTLAELVEVFLPRGWFLPVTPGTMQVSLGGAIAADVHGKNHHQAGCFSRWVEELELMLPSGEVRACSPTSNRELFLATCGGMGLTGVILSARLRLVRTPSSYITETVRPAANLDQVLELFQRHHQEPFSVAWCDVLQKGPRLGRSIFMCGHFAENAPHDPLPSGGLSVPLAAPGFLLNQGTMRLFNELYFGLKRKPRTHQVHLRGFFYPLDAIANWNLLYGSRGFVQYQFVLPTDAGREGLRAVLDQVSRSGLGSFLTVLKLLGPANDNLLSFPQQGYTLAMDFKVEPGTFALLDRLDQVVHDCGGRLYLAKDARMPPWLLRAGYPGLERFAALRDRLGLRGRLESLQSLRLEL